MSNRQEILISVMSVLDGNEVRYHVRDRGDSTALTCPFSIPNGPTVDVLFIARDEDPSVGVRLHGLVNRVSEEKRAAVTELLNSLNDRYRFIKFVLNGNGDIGIDADLPVSIPLTALGDVCLELFIRILKVVKESYTELQRTLWT